MATRTGGSRDYRLGSLPGEIRHSHQRHDRAIARLQMVVRTRAAATRHRAAKGLEDALVLLLGHRRVGQFGARVASRAKTYPRIPSSVLASTALPAPRWARTKMELQVMPAPEWTSFTRCWPARRRPEADGCHRAGPVRRPGGRQSTRDAAGLRSPRSGDRHQSARAS